MGALATSISTRSTNFATLSITPNRDCTLMSVLSEELMTVFGGPEPPFATSTSPYRSMASSMHSNTRQLGCRPRFQTISVHNCQHRSKRFMAPHASIADA